MQISEASDSFGRGLNSFNAAGGISGIKQLVEDFYQEMDQQPKARRIRSMHSMELTETKDKLTRFLTGWLGGPNLYHEKYGRIRIPQAHQHLPIDQDEQDAWLSCMQQALNQQGYELKFIHYLMQQFQVPAERIRLASQASK